LSPPEEDPYQYLGGDVPGPGSIFGPDSNFGSGSGPAPDSIFGPAPAHGFGSDFGFGPEPSTPPTVAAFVARCKALLREAGYVLNSLEALMSQRMQLVPQDA
jgi:hypothetical protein